MRLFLIFISLASFLTIQKRELDQRLIGQWTMLHTKDATGAIVKDEFYGKKYTETFAKDGRLILDPQFLRDDMKRAGVNFPLEYSDIPTLTWKTINNEILEIGSDQGSGRNRCGFLGDTLIFGYDSGNTRYLLKRK
jgi:hypothetical protein